MNYLIIFLDYEKIFNTVENLGLQCGFIKKPTLFEGTINNFLMFVYNNIIVFKSTLNGKFFKKYDEVKFRLALGPCPRESGPDHQKISYFFNLLSYEINHRKPDFQKSGFQIKCDSEQSDRSAKRVK